MSTTVMVAPGLGESEVGPDDGAKVRAKLPRA
jgi:hypothetical protein